MISFLLLVSFNLVSAEYKFLINKESYKSSIVIESAKKCMEDYNQNGQFCEKLLLDSFGLNCTIGDLNTENKDCTIVLEEIRTVTCSGGYTDNGDGTCSGTQVISASYSCPTNYSPYSSSTCSRYRTRSPSEGSCPSGYSNISSVCIKKIGYANVCPSNYWFDPEMEICSTTNGSSPYYLSSTCTSGTKYGSNCYNTSDTANKPLTCSTGYTLNGNTCEGTFYKNKIYSCSSGYTLSGSTCSKSVTEVSGIAGCTSGYIEFSSTLCKKTIIEAATISCPETYNYNEVEDRCEKMDVIPLL